MITERDRAIVAMLDETGGLDLPSIQLMFGMARTPAYRRMNRLEQYGMITAMRPFLRSPALYVPTARGLREMLGREDLKAPSVGPGSYSHKVQVAHVLAELEHRGVRWQSERRTRREQKLAELAGDRTESKRYAIELSWLEESHRPDALMWPSPTAEAIEQPVAIEVELAQKSKSRLDEILQGYATSLDFAGVLYVAGPHSLNAVQGAVGRLEERAHIAHVVSIYEFGPHFGPPRIGGRPSRKQAVQTEHQAAAPRSWVDEYLSDGQVSRIEELMRGPAAATPTLLG